jgi:predicted transcriptional regulator of viral defense system
MAETKARTWKAQSLRTIDDVIAEIAGRQHGIVTRWQLAQAGINDEAVRWRVTHGRLLRVHRGVYSMSPWLSMEARRTAARLAAGRSSALSHRTAAHEWGLVPRAAATIEIVTPRQPRTIAGARVRSTSTLVADDVVRHDGAVVTSVARTIVDLGDVVPASRVAKAMHEAEFLGRLDLSLLEECLARNTGRRHVSAVLREALALHLSGSSGSRSRPEERLLAGVVRAGQPEPRLNTPFWLVDEEIEVDLHWPDLRLAVEADGGGHLRRRTRREDARRGAKLRANDWRVLRIPTWFIDRHLHQAVDLVATAIAER